MASLLVSQRNFESHHTPPGHPERPDRIRAIEAALSAPEFAGLVRKDAPAGDLSLADVVHAPGYIQALAQIRPAEGMAQIDEDTFISSGSLDAAATALGAGLLALEAVALGEVENAFCAVRPPGHHAERERPMGFCLINTVAVVAREAQRKFGAERVAIVDFDVHHGNGTQDIFYNDTSVFYGSTHQMPLFPGSGARDERGAGNICNAPLAARSGKGEMQAAYEQGLVVQTRPGTVPQLKRYLDEQRGVALSDVWPDIPPLNSQAQERLGYPTQKPLALLERIIAASSNEGDVVLDPFCGCGTAVHAAQKLGRQWIGIDVIHLAISLIEKRLRDAFPGIELEVHGTPKDLASAEDLALRDKYQFQWWAVSMVDALPLGGKK